MRAGRLLRVSRRLTKLSDSRTRQEGGMIRLLPSLHLSSSNLKGKQPCFIGPEPGTWVLQAELVPEWEHSPSMPHTRARLPV